MTKTGDGTVTSSPAGIDCGTACSTPFDDGTSVTLTATPRPGWGFAGWSGACTGTDPCVVDITESGVIDVAAMFSSVTLDIALAGDAMGVVTSEPAGISCGTTCTAMFPPGSMVTLTAMPVEEGTSFTSWSSTGCTGTGPCTLVLTEAMTSITATFNKRGSRTFTTSGTFMVPPGVSSVRVLAVGGGGGGANGHQGGGGSGFVATGTFAVTAGTMVAVTVGAPGVGAVACDGCNEIVGNTPGGSSSFGALLSASGGRTPTVINGPGGNGGSGGGGSCNAGPVGGAGGTGGTPGGPCSYAGGTGQGSFAALAAFSVHAFTPGPGGAGGMSTHAGGGGGGGVLLDGTGPSGQNGGVAFSGKGGGGYGGGGGAGGYDASGNVRIAGGNGAPGLVYVEW